jgi:hypothetical protein
VRAVLFGDALGSSVKGEAREEEVEIVGGADLGGHAGQLAADTVGVEDAAFVESVSQAEMRMAGMARECAHRRPSENGNWQSEADRVLAELDMEMLLGKVK